MITISFENKQHAQDLYQRLTKWGKSLKYIDVSIKDKSEVHVIGEKGISTYTSLVFIPVFIQFIIDSFEGPTIIDLLKKDFHYRDEDECCLIYNMFTHLVDDMPLKLEDDEELKGRKQYLMELLQDFLTPPIHFSYESFVQFRLKEYREYLLGIVERAIDEYKLEQNVQTHLNVVRDYIKNRQIFLNRINILINDGIRVYDEHFNEIALEYIPIDQQLMRQCHYAIDEKVVAPIISLSPRRVSVYASAKEENFVIGLYNLFQERMKWYPLSVFFLEQKKSLQIHD